MSEEIQEIIFKIRNFDEKSGKSDEEIRDILDNLKFKKLTPIAFHWLRKVKTKREGENIFHLAARTGHLDLDLFESTSSPLSSEQVLEILTEVSGENNSIFYYAGFSRENGIGELKSYKVIRSIVETFKIPRKTLKNLMLDEPKNRINVAYFHYKGTEFDQFSEECRFYGLNTKEFLKMLVFSNGNEGAANQFIKFTPTLSAMIKTVKDLKASPEDFISLFLWIKKFKDSAGYSYARNSNFAKIGLYAESVIAHPYGKFVKENVIFESIVESCKRDYGKDSAVVFGLKLIGRMRSKLESSFSDRRKSSLRSYLADMRPRPLQKTLVRGGSYV
jgi:hypothetical protein